jgi:hypothetical protein
MARRQCCGYKLKPIKTEVRRRLGYPHPARVPAGVPPRWPSASPPTYVPGFFLSVVQEPSCDRSCNSGTVLIQADVRQPEV